MQPRSYGCCEEAGIFPVPVTSTTPGRWAFVDRIESDPSYRDKAMCGRRVPTALPAGQSEARSKVLLEAVPETLRSPQKRTEEKCPAPQESSSNDLRIYGLRGSVLEARSEPPALLHAQMPRTPASHQNVPKLRRGIQYQVQEE